jgi:hypothetical protein
LSSAGIETPLFLHRKIQRVIMFPKNAVQTKNLEMEMLIFKTYQNSKCDALAEIRCIFYAAAIKLRGG